MLYDLQETVTEIPTDYFRQNLLLDLMSPIHPRDVVTIMRNKGYIRDDRWSLWPMDPCDTLDPTTQKLMHEDKVFQPLETLAKQVLEAFHQLQDEKGSPRSNASFVFKCNPSRAPKSDARSDVLSRPDTYGIEADAEAVTDARIRALWAQIALPGEFKKNAPGADTNDNNTKILWSMHHIMRDDASRRFVLGFTIENRSMRWWYCSRSEVFVTKEIDFFAEQELVCDFFLRVMLGERSQLGWDSTMRPAPSTKAQETTQYDITVHDVSSDKLIERTFRTKRLIWNYGADALRGRGTRVWAAVEVINKKETMDMVVVKEAWRDESRLPEGKLAADIRKQILTRGPKDVKVLDALFMETVAYGDVLIDGAVDSTAAFKPCRANAPLPEKLSVIHVSVGNKHKRRIVGAARLGHQVIDKKAKRRSSVVKYPTKIHHRTVFKDVGEPLLQVESLKDVFTSLSQVITGLKLLHRYGWVHRDISYGNVLRVKEYTKITDIEYAKEVSETSTHRGVRTGTPYFMAIEVATGSYMFMPEKQAEVTSAVDDEDLVADLDNNTKAAKSAAPLEQPPIPPPISEKHSEGVKPVIYFRHNPLHDLESVAWLSLYSVVVPEFEISKRRRGEAAYTAAEWATLMENQHALAYQAFCDPMDRISIVKTSGYLARDLEGLHPTVAQIIGEISGMFDDLAQAHRRAETTVEPGPDNVLQTYSYQVAKQMGDRIKDIQRHLDRENLTLIRDVSKRRYIPAAPRQAEGDQSAPTRDDVQIANDTQREAEPEAGSAEEEREEDTGRRTKARRLTHSDDAASSSRTLPPIESLANRILAAKDNGSDSDS
ncbi:hypothetical protein PsYK624_112390 [Phanerochaete sordida]|uniref:Protein kinase domain-containing protein n=1 Tax=Phanerochaete sordida TaxID=48140 RepID=A0A9P3GHE8_9APHY|nr:hypothetical protein PsYK624_112390 [Phanerochaete sordida]